MSFCPRCGTHLVDRISGDRTRQTCPSEGCGFTDYGEQSIATGAVVVRNGGFLLIQRRSPTRTWWQIPGGYVEIGESIDDAVVREVQEETGITARVTDILGLRHSSGAPPARLVSNLYVVFRLEAIEGQPRGDGQESFDAGFFSQAEILDMEGVSAMSHWAIEKALGAESHGGFQLQAYREGLHRPGFTLYGFELPRFPAQER